MAPSGSGGIKREQWNAMIRGLLEDRFKLKLHRETKDLPVYALVLGKTPPALKESAKDTPPRFSPGERGRMTFQHMPIVALVNTLSNILHEPVIDATGISGFFDFTLDPMQLAAPAGSASAQPIVRESYADLTITAVTEQLGFRLERRRAPLEITVIDHAERPTEN
jgi:uncharacterized protein (TIGR03435 family)